MTDDADRRLVRLITRLNIGGPARQALLLTRELHEWRSVLGAGRPRDDEGELSDPAVTVRYLPLVRPLAPATDARGLAAVRRLLVEHRPLLLHTHMAKAGTLGRLAALSVRPRPRLVHTFHGHVLEGYFSGTVQRAFVRVERMLAARTDVLVAVSAEIRDQLLELRIGTESQYRVIPLGFDLAQHRSVRGQRGALRERLGLGADVPLVGIVGRLVPIKDHGLLFDAMERVPDAHLAVIGDGELRQTLEARVAGTPLAARVHFVGWWLDIPAAMADLDVVALTSRNEGTPVSLIEAAACGRPVVATNVGGNRSVVDDGVTGFVVPTEAGAVADAITRLLADPALRERMGAAGRASSWRFESTRLVSDIASLYDELVPPR